MASSVISNPNTKAVYSSKLMKKSQPVLFTNKMAIISISLITPPKKNINLIDLQNEHSIL